MNAILDEDADGDQQRMRWWAIYALSCGTFLTAIDATVVNVALPVLGHDLHMGRYALVWVVNAYLCPFGGFLLISGRLGDLFGRRRVFIAAIALFALASLGCGISSAAAPLLVMRALQGLSAAAVSTIGMALTASLFPETGTRARALGFFSFVGAAGGSTGVLLGGVVTGALGWHWIFYINVPFGVVVVYLCMKLIPRDPVQCGERLNVAGGVVVTTALLLANFAVTDTSEFGARSLVSGAAAVALLVLFILIESRAIFPTVPRDLLALGNFIPGNIVGSLVTVASLSWFFISTQYLQYVLHLNPLEAGLSFLPATLFDAVVSIGVVPLLIRKYGIGVPTMIGFTCTFLGLLLFARAPVSGSVFRDVLPPMMFMGIGIALAYNPIFLASMIWVSNSQAGVASGVLNASWALTGTVGLAFVMKLATDQTQKLEASGVNTAAALTRGYHWSFTVSAITVLVAALVSGLYLRSKPRERSPSLI